MSQVLAQLDLATQDLHFEGGMKSEAASLNDPLKDGTAAEPAWEAAFSSPAKLHGVLLSAGSDRQECQKKLDKITGILGSSIRVTTTISGKVRPGAMEGHEQ